MRGGRTVFLGCAYFRGVWRIQSRTLPATRAFASATARREELCFRRGGVVLKLPHRAPSRRGRSPRAARPRPARQGSRRPGAAGTRARSAGGPPARGSPGSPRRQGRCRSAASWCHGRASQRAPRAARRPRGQTRRSAGRPALWELWACEPPAAMIGQRTREVRSGRGGGAGARPSRRASRGAGGRERVKNTGTSPCGNGSGLVLPARPHPNAATEGDAPVVLTHQPVWRGTRRCF